MVCKRKSQVMTALCILAAMIIFPLNIFGQETFSQSFGVANLINFELEGPAGLYFVEIQAEDGKSARLKVLKE